MKKIKLKAPLQLLLLNFLILEFVVVLAFMVFVCLFRLGLLVLGLNLNSTMSVVVVFGVCLLFVLLVTKKILDMIIPTSRKIWLKMESVYELHLIRNVSMYPKLFDVIDNLTLELNLSQPDIYVLDSPIINAALVSDGLGDLKLVVTSQLVESLDSDVAKCVLAQEFYKSAAHYKKFNWLMNQYFYTNLFGLLRINGVGLFLFVGLMFFYDFAISSFGTLDKGIFVISISIFFFTLVIWQFGVRSVAYFQAEFNQYFRSAVEDFYNQEFDFAAMNKQLTENRNRLKSVNTGVNAIWGLPVGSTRMVVF